MAAPLLDTPTLRHALELTGAAIAWETDIEILIVGGAAGMITGLLRPERTTSDCDIVNVAPAEAAAEVERAARQAAAQMDLPPGWLNDRARQVNALPDGWRSRRRQVGTFGRLRAYAIGRLDLLAMKLYANRPQDRQDIRDIGVTPDDFDFLRRHLNMLRVASRHANLDQVVAAEELLAAFEAEGGRA